MDTTEIMLSKPEDAKIIENINKSKAKTWKETLKDIKDNITIEPMLACYVIPGTLARLATQDLNLDKACRVNLAYGNVVCDALLHQKGDSYRNEEEAVQQLVASMEIWKNALLSSIPCFLLLFLGAWSDRTRRRKICILMPTVGELLMCLSNMLNVYYFYELPVQVTMFMEAIFPAITGSWICSFMGVFSYISDVTNEETRTFRMGIVMLCMTAGGPIGSALSGVLLRSIGYYGVFSICSGLYIFSLIYGILYIKDPPKPVQIEDSNKVQSTGVFGFLKSFFDIKHVKDTFAVVLKKGPNNRRFKFAIIFIAIGFSYGPAYGEYIIRYLFTRYRFNWDVLKYSFYNTFYICIHGIGALISITIFSRRLKWNDSILALISSVSKIAGGMATGLARNSFQMYLAVVIETFNATTYTALRSLSSKLVASDELGKFTSMFNLVETLTYVVFGPLYSWLYMLSLSFDAGFIFYFSTLLTIPAILIHTWFFIQHKRNVKLNIDQPEVNDNNEQDNIQFIDQKDDNTDVLLSGISASEHSHK